MCNNTNGSFVCSCEMGYQLDSSGLNCSGMLTTQLCLIQQFCVFIRQTTCLHLACPGWAYLTL